MFSSSSFSDPLFQTSAGMLSYPAALFSDMVLITVVSSAIVNGSVLIGSWSSTIGSIATSLMLGGCPSSSWKCWHHC